MGDFELCCECDGETGRAGAGEDSLYAGDKGPYCENCWYDLPEKFADEIARLRADMAEAREVVRHFLANRGGIVVSSDHEMALETEMMRRTRAFIDRRRDGRR